MQALLLFAIFTLLFTVVSSIITGGQSSSAQLRAQRIADTQQYFKDIDKVVNNDITLNQWMANVINVNISVADYIRKTPALAQLATGRWGDPALDAWGKPVGGKIITQRQVIYSDATNNLVVTAPVTGFILVSSGPDQISQTDISGINTLAAMNGAVPATGSDDIVYTFTDEIAQRQQLQVMQGRVGRVASAALQNYQMRLNDYRRTRLATYQQQLAAGATVDLTAMMTDDANAPTFLDLADKTQRNQLGVDEEITQLEKPLPKPEGVVSNLGGGNLIMQSAVSGNTLTIKMLNSAKPTPWLNSNAGSSLVYQISVKGS